MSEIDTIRKQLRAAAEREPQSVQPFIGVLDTQLRNYAKGDAEDRAALRPEIEKSLKLIETARVS